MKGNNQQLTEKLREIEYLKLNFKNQLKVLEIEKRRLLKQVSDKVDLEKIDKIKKEINEK